jgi:hexosaminidase
MTRIIGTLLFLALLCFPLAAQEGLPPLIPKPVSLVLGTGEFLFDAATPIITEPGASHVTELAALASEQIRLVTGIATQVRTSKRGGAERHAIVLRKSSRLARLGPEGYAMSVRESLIVIEAPAEAGLWYGMQTFLQLLPPTGNVTSARIPALSIEDRPRFAWRGMHLDVCRHFFPVSFIKRYIDFLAMYKMNRFHWHLTDDQGGASRSSPDRSSPRWRRGAPGRWSVPSARSATTRSATAGSTHRRRSVRSSPMPRRGV